MRWGIVLVNGHCFTAGQQWEKVGEGITSVSPCWELQSSPLRILRLVGLGVKGAFSLWARAPGVTLFSPQV